MTETVRTRAARKAIDLTGIVQGVGFRPYVYRLANECGLTGLIANTPAGVSIEVQGDAEAVIRRVTGDVSLETVRDRRILRREQRDHPGLVNAAPERDGQAALDADVGRVPCAQKRSAFPQVADDDRMMAFHARPGRP